SFLAGPTAAAFHRSTADQRVNKLARLHPCLMIQGPRQGFRQDAVDPLPQEVAFRRAVAARQCAKPLVLISLDINLFSLHASHVDSYTLQYTSCILEAQHPADLS